MTRQPSTVALAPARPAKRQTSEVRRQQIAEAALRILAARGPNRLTAVELAREVGIADGTIFRHFRDKAEIVRLAIDYLHQMLVRDFSPPVSLPPLERLDVFVRSRLQLAQQHPNLYSLALSDRLLEAVEEVDLAPLRQIVARSHEFVEQCLRDAQAEGTVDARLPATSLAFLVMAAVCVHGAARRIGMKCERHEESPDAAWQALRALLCRHEPSASRALSRGSEERRVEG